MTILRKVLLVTLASALIVGVGGTNAQAKSKKPTTYAQVQRQVAFTVYAPKVTFGLKRTTFSLNGCGPLNFLNAGYGTQDVTATWLAFNESSKPCTDGPDGVGPAATVTVKGAKAVIMGSCAGGASTCAHATGAGVKRTAFTEVTLPAVQRTPTYVQLYTQGMSIGQITAFLQGMHAVLAKP